LQLEIRMTDSTRQSLLLRVRNPQDSVSWQEFFALYERS